MINDTTIEEATQKALQQYALENRDDLYFIVCALKNNNYDYFQCFSKFLLNI